MEIFVSWFEGMRENRSSIEILRDSGIIDGVELSSMRADTGRTASANGNGRIPSSTGNERTPFVKADMEPASVAVDAGRIASEIEAAGLIHSVGLKAGLHDPLKRFSVDLSDRSLKEHIESSGLVSTVRRCDTPFISFHLGFTRIHERRSVEAIFRASIDNIGYLAKLTGKKILFETPSYLLKHANTETGDVFNEITSPGFIRRVLDNADCGFLLDLPHAFITGLTREYLKGGMGCSNEHMRCGTGCSNEYLRGGTAFSNEYFNALLDSGSSDICQLHVSVPHQESVYGFTDAHGFLQENDGVSDRIIEMCQEAVRRSQNLRAVTLEMSSSLQAEEHAVSLVGQACRIRSLIGMKG